MAAGPCSMGAAHAPSSPRTDPPLCRGASHRCTLPLVLGHVPSSSSTCHMTKTRLAFPHNASMPILSPCTTLLRLQEAAGASTDIGTPRRISTPAKATNRCRSSSVLSPATPPPQNPTKPSEFAVFPTIGAQCGLETSSLIWHR
jgi:hypothetical protein